MSRMQIEFPEKVHFTVELEVRVSDLNYGGHLGNDRVLTLAQEARVKFLRSLGYSELDVEGAGLIMNEAMVKYDKEAFEGDLLSIDMHIGDFSAVGFHIYYRFRREEQQIALVRTGLVFYDYAKKKVTRVPAGFSERF